MRTITKEIVEKFRNYLLAEEKALATLEKYIRDVRAFSAWLGGKCVDKKEILNYKEELCEKYSVASVNSVISALNTFFAFCDWNEFIIKAIKMQRQIFASKEKELTKQEYERLLRTAESKGNERLYLLMQTICSSGIRVSELKYITVESLKKERAEINCKGKRRQVLLPTDLCKMLKAYAERQKIKSGPVFITKTGKPLDRSNIWSDMKKLCREAGVSEKKVFPHNLRHLFARTYYTIPKDIVRLADILGHSSINTTRIYTMENGDVHRRQIQKLGLLRC
ncbi:MAG: integrase [Ruminococcaceae bacterium]|nr:integrase [Oscillospiraceae bacterium]